MFGFPIEVNPTFLLLLVIALLFWGGLAGVIGVLIAFASVLLHELGHALVARRLGVSVAGIELHLLGGAAKMVGQPKTANDEVKIAAAGPAVSFALAGVGFMLGAVTGALGFDFGALLFAGIGWINLVIGGFNLVPALPMDGGRILRALLTRKFEYARATDIAIKVARGFAVAFGLVGLFTASLWLLLLVPFLWILGIQERHMAHLLNNHFTYDKNGYRRYDYADVEVMPRGFADILDHMDGNDAGGDGPYRGVQSYGWPGLGFRRGGPGRPVSFGGYVIRRRNGRLVIEFIG